MQYEAHTPDDYIKQLPEDRKEPVVRLRQIIKESLPEGFEEGINYGMIGFYVPHSIYPNGYHCDKKQPLPFINLASQKHYIALYHMGMYANKALLEWFKTAYSEQCRFKLDMGKSCIRFKKMDAIPYELVGELCAKMTVGDWINIYEAAIKKK
ncbi:DUF1801 domain-containing protein [Snuella sedimenti]|uniref:DUF1801 domain-containing protein n=1 Tax=Snuella sedimenti TaxID=2798802 RepID=A0A8J7LXI1_9FLAO|nr:DUF1801 domain-containing protein [Snuella sedimenti]MBJ6366791.1 DUF1801 domain-containing protein [Snuella sedimenti]